jgi:hypothetical protein
MDGLPSTYLDKSSINFSLSYSNSLSSDHEIPGEAPSNSQILIYDNGYSPTCCSEQESYFIPKQFLPLSTEESRVKQDGFEPFCYSDLGPAGWEPKWVEQGYMSPKVCGSGLLL